MDKKLLFVSDLCRKLGISSNIAYKLVHTKWFPCTVLGGRILILEFELENWLACNSNSYRAILQRDRGSSNRVRSTRSSQRQPKSLDSGKGELPWY